VTEDRRTLLRDWLARLTLDPLDPYQEGENRYVPLEESGRGAVDQIFATIDLHLDTTTQLLSGPNGSGKTTELLRLKGTLQEVGFTVALVDILQFVNRSAPIDVTDCLIAVALGAGEQLPQPAESSGGFGRRFADFLGRLSITFDAGVVSGSVSAEKAGVQAAGVGVEIDLKRELKNSESFVRELRGKLAYHVGSLYDEVAGYFRQLASASRALNPNTRGLVVIVDSLEKLRGTQDNDERVQASVEGLFVHHADKLRFKSHHMVYTVPTYLLFTAPGALPYDGRVRPVPIPHVRSRNGLVDEESNKSVDELIDVIAKRIPWERLLGDQENLDRVIAASGGHLRDLFLILHEVITQVYGRHLELPVTTRRVEEALDSLAHSFSSVTKEQADFMRRVMAAGGAIEPTEGEVHLMARLMDTHMLLAHMNGQDWYEVHPLARRSLEL
jgi:hypothetical protein